MSCLHYKNVTIIYAQSSRIMLLRPLECMYTSVTKNITTHEICNTVKIKESCVRQHHKSKIQFLTHCTTCGLQHHKARAAISCQPAVCTVLGESDTTKWKNQYLVTSQSWLCEVTQLCYATEDTYQFRLVDIKECRLRVCYIPNCSKWPPLICEHNSLILKENLLPFWQFHHCHFSCNISSLACHFWS